MQTRGPDDVRRKEPGDIELGTPTRDPPREGDSEVPPEEELLVLRFEWCKEGGEEYSWREEMHSDIECPTSGRELEATRESPRYSQKEIRLEGLASAPATDTV